MESGWCRECCTRHPAEARCPGALLATGPERHGWRVNVETGTGIEAIGVLVAESAGLWRARILTYPKTLWLMPGGDRTLKFVGRTPREAEQGAIDFIRAHCLDRGYLVRDELIPVEVARIPPEAKGPPAPHRPPARRKIRFLPVRYGLERLTEAGGTGNLSETGLFVITDRPETPGQWLNLILDAEGSDLELRGYVRWMRRQHHAGRSPGMGLQLQAPPLTYLSYVRSLP